MDPVELAKRMGIGRVALGIGFILLPGPLGRLWVGGKADDDGVKLLVRAIGVRDLVLGLGILSALRDGGNARGWVSAAAVSDAVDVAAVVAAGDAVPGYARASVIALGGGSALQGAVAAPRLDGAA